MINKNYLTLICLIATIQVFSQTDTSDITANTLLVNDSNTTNDWGTLWQSGFYQSQDAANGPGGEQGWFWGLNMNHSSNTADYKYNGQLAIKNNHTNPTMYFRSTYKNGNGTWAKILHDQGDQKINGALTTNLINMYNDEEGAISGYLRADTDNLVLYSNVDGMSISSTRSMDLKTQEFIVNSETQSYKADYLTFNGSEEVNFKGSGDFSVYTNNGVNLRGANDVEIKSEQGDVNIQSKIFFVDGVSNFKGNVGIGTANPLSELHVAGTTTTNQINLFNDEEGSVIGYIDAKTDHINLHSNADGMSLSSGYSMDLKTKEFTLNSDIQSFRGQEFRVDAKDEVNFRVDGSFNVYNAEHINMTSTNELSIKSDQIVNIQSETFSVEATSNFNGNVGIGTTSPSKKLDVSGDINFTGDLYKNGVLFNPSGTVSNFDGLQPVLIQESGNVGMGITNPISKLHVDGTITTNRISMFNEEENMVTGYMQSDPSGLIIKSNGDVLTLSSGNNLDLYTTEFSVKSERQDFNGDYLDFKVAEEVKFSGLGAFNVTNADMINLFSRSEVDIKSKEVHTQSDIFSVTAPTSYFIGKVGIGTRDPKNELSVNGTIWAKNVKVRLTDAADWVFEKDYQLRSLAEVKAFINKNKHLPEIPSAAEFRANDMEVADMTNKLLQKIEELTLYSIQHQEKNEALEAQLKVQEKELQKMKVLETRLTMIEKMLNN